MVNKKILVTAGPVWVPLDSVRILTNRFTGRTGYGIARFLAVNGYDVDLQLGPSSLIVRSHDNMNVERFTYFAELHNNVIAALKRKRYAAIVHSAAVADYLPENIYDGKIRSKQKDLSFNMVPAPKIIKDMRRLAASSLLIQFKLEVGLSREELIDAARASLRSNSSDYVIANDLTDMSDGKYRGILINGNKSYVNITSRHKLNDVILDLLKRECAL